MLAKSIKDIVSYRNTSNDLIDFVAKKTERLTSALYLVSDLISPNEPLKTLLRKKGLSILSDMFSCAPPRAKKDTKENVFLKILVNIAEINALLRIAGTSGIVSEMNANILQKEYINLSSLLESRRDDFCHSEKEVMFGDNFFDKDAKLPTIGLDEGESKGHDKRHPFDKGQTRVFDKTFGGGADKKLLHENNDTAGIKQTRNNIETTFDRHIKDNAIQEERKETIVRFIKDTNGNVNIKDISTRIRGCSEKTLQRDLISLVQKGVLKKSGERRWSRYSIVVV
jgi:hypothetical protein